MSMFLEQLPLANTKRKANNKRNRKREREREEYGHIK
jgi:hypothetical protein